METTSVCTVTYFSYFHLVPNFRADNFVYYFRNPFLRSLFIRLSTV